MTEWEPKGIVVPVGTVSLECPGCFAWLERATPERTLATVLAHGVLCGPPGVVDLLAWHTRGEITPAMARWVGASIARMAGAPPTVGQAYMVAAEGSPQDASGPTP